MAIFGTDLASAGRGGLPACTAFIPFPKDSAPTQIRPPPALLSPARPCTSALKLIDEITANVYNYITTGDRASLPSASSIRSIRCAPCKIGSNLGQQLNISPGKWRFSAAITMFDQSAP